jgi:hypothetical protein
MWSHAYSSRNIWALYGAHLTFKAWRESRSRQENRYGRHAVHIRGLAFYGCKTIHKHATNLIPICHGNVKNFFRFECRKILKRQCWSSPGVIVTRCRCDNAPRSWLVHLGPRRTARQLVQPSFD